MNIIKKLIFKDILLNKKRSLATVVGIMLSVALFVSVSTIYISGIDIIKDYDKKTQGNYHLALADLKPSEINSYYYNRNIEKIINVRKLGWSKLDDGKTNKNSYGDLICLEAIEKQDFDDLAINIIEGRLPKNDKEVLVPKDYIDKRTVEVGDTITLDIGKKNVKTNINEKTNDETNENSNDETSIEEESEEKKYSFEIIDSKKENYKIVGVVNYTYSNLMGGIHGFKKQDYYFFDGERIITLANNKTEGIESNLFIRYKKEAIKNYAKVTVDIVDKDKKIDFDFNNSLLYIESSYLFNMESKEILLVVFIMLVLILIGSFMFIKNCFDISSTERLKYDGILKSVGATYRQIKYNVFYEANMLMIVAIPLGIILGLLASDIVFKIIDSFSKDLVSSDKMCIKMTISYKPIMIGTLLAIATVYFSVFRIAVKNSKISPIEAIKNSGQIKINRKKIKSSKFIKKIFGIGGILANKNVKRNKKKYNKTIRVIKVSVILFMAASNILNFAQIVISERYTYDYNFSIRFPNKYYDDIKEIEKNNKSDYIQRSSIQRRQFCNVNDCKYTKEYADYLNQAGKKYKENISILCLGNEAYERYIECIGLEYNDIKDKGILISDDDYSVINKFDYKKDDKINIEPDTDPNTNISIELGAVYQRDKTREVTAYNNVYSNPMVYDDVIIVSDDLYENIFSDQSKVNEGEHVSAYFYVNNPKQFEENIKNVLGKKIEYMTIDNQEKEEEKRKDEIKLASILIYMFISVFFVLAILNIFNTISFSMQFRKREFAMLKAVGMSKKQFFKMIRLEALIIVFKALYKGVILVIVMVSLAFYMRYRLYLSDYLVRCSIYLIKTSMLAVFVVIVIVFTIMFFSIRKINKQNIIESIRNDNL